MSWISDRYRYSKVLLHCPVSGAVLRNPVKQLLAVHVTAVEIATKNASSDSGVLPESPPLPHQIRTAKRTSKCIRILTNINSREGFFYFSHNSIPNMRQSVSNLVAHVPAWHLGCWPSDSSCCRTARFQLQERPAEQLPLESREMSK